MAHRAPIIIVPYRSEWPQMFADEQERLTLQLPAKIKLEHIGSTSVVGLEAKPIVDIMLGAQSLVEVEALLPTLEALGYEYLPETEQQLPMRRFLAFPNTRPRAIHLHAVALDSDFWREHVAFRDALRKDAHLARAYGALKRQLACKYGDDRAGYTEAKSAFIYEVLSRAAQAH